MFSFSRSALRPSPISSLLLLASLVWLPTAEAQARTAGDPRKQARATRLTNESIRLDGRLDEEIWNRTAPLSDFVQKEPNEGSPPSERWGWGRT